MKKYILLALCFLCGTGLCHIKAQIIIFPDSLFTTMFKSRVKQVDEFISIFNSNAPVPGFPATDSLKRQRQIFRLINHQMGEANKQETFEKIMRFANVVAKDSVCLSFSDSTWFAEVECNIILKKEKKKATLFLRTEKEDEYVYKWAICGVRGDFWGTKTDSTKRNMIPPTSNNLNFMFLSTMTDKNHAPHIFSYKAQSVPLHPLSIFLTMVWSGELEIVYAENVKYHFLQVPGHIFTIRYFNREDMNAGWLIDNVLAISEEEKYQYVKHLFLMQHEKDSLYSINTLR